MTLSLACPAFCNFSSPLWLRTLLNILFIWLCTKCLFYGIFTPFIILRRRWIGSRGHALTLWTTRLCADLSLFRSCWDSRKRSFCGTWFLSRFTRPGHTVILVPTPNGWKNSWLCPDFTTGTTLLKKRASTKILLSTFLGSTRFSELTTFLRHGRSGMD